MTGKNWRKNLSPLSIGLEGAIPPVPPTNRANAFISSQSERLRCLGGHQGGTKSQPLNVLVLQQRPAAPDNSQHAMAHQMAYQETQNAKNPK
jgi:hypothetical protein